MLCLLRRENCEADDFPSQGRNRAGRGQINERKRLPRTSKSGKGLEALIRNNVSLAFLVIRKSRFETLGLEISCTKLMNMGIIEP